MIVRCGLLKKHDRFTTEEFSNHWVNVHGPIAADMDNLREYKQNLVVDRAHRHPSNAGKIDIDGFSELHFDTWSEMMQGIQSLDAETGNALLDDAEYFSQKRLCDILVFFRKVVREVPAYLRDKDLIHRVSFISKPDDMTPAQFQREWCYLHAKFVETVPGFVGYNQNLVLDRFVDGKPATHGQLPVDGMVELYFDSMEGLECFTESPEFKLVNDHHGSSMIGAINTYLVETHTIIDGAESGGYPL